MEPRKTFPHGNYPSYYNYRQADSRIGELLQAGVKGFVRGKRCLDVGCNSGRFTIEAALQLEPAWILGYDIDPTLIRKAKRNVFDMSKALDILSDGDQDGEGGVRYPALSVAPCASAFPWNIRFACGDILTADIRPSSYDVIFCMSVTKWIHLNGGDQAIRQLFSTLHRTLRIGGVLVLEPQPYSSYARRKDLSSEIAANYGEIQLRPEQFVAHLESLGFVLLSQRGNMEDSRGFIRCVYVLQRKR